MEVLAQVISIAAMLVSTFSLQCKKNQSMFILRGLSGLMFSISYVLLGAYTGAALNLINLLRSVFLVGKKTRGKLFLGIMLSLYTAATVLTFAGPLSLLILAAQFVETGAMWSRNGKVVRVAQLSFVSPSWMLYNIVEFSLGGIMAEAMVIISAIVSFFRFRKTGFDKT